MGKTGSLASLANAGYRLFIYDFDNGLDALARYVQPEFKKNVYFKTYGDKLKAGKRKFIGSHGLVAMVPSAVPDGTPTAFANFLSDLDDWKEGDVSMGSIRTWGPKDVAVFDTLTFMSDAAMRLILDLNKIEHPRVQDYGTLGEIMLPVFEVIKSPEVKCNLVVITHIKVIGGEDDKPGAPPPMAYPNALGQMVPRKIGSYFNCIASCRQIGSGPSARRIINTETDPEIGLKSPAPPNLIPRELPLSTGLADYFKLLKDAAKAPPATSASVVTPVQPPKV